MCVLKKCVPAFSAFPVKVIFSPGLFTKPDLVPLFFNWPTWPGLGVREPRGDGGACANRFFISVEYLDP